MNEPTLLLIYAYFSAFHMFQVTAIENSMISATYEIPTKYHSKKEANENQQSPSSCFMGHLTYSYNVLQPYCLSNKFNFIHTAFFGYIPAFYPILLIFLTWICTDRATWS